jgi:hypothetical protein
MQTGESAKTGLLLNIQHPFVRVIDRNIIVFLIDTGSIQVHLQYKSL